jgi:hypothetical protein
LAVFVINRADEYSRVSSEKKVVSYVSKAGHITPDSVQIVDVYFADKGALLVIHVRDDVSLGINDHRVAVTLPPIVVHAHLVGR